eukprot:2025877-Rhodomonas_salina.2
MVSDQPSSSWCQILEPDITIIMVSAVAFASSSASHHDHGVASQIILHNGACTQFRPVMRQRSSSWCPIQ